MAGRLEQWERDELADLESLYASGQYRELCQRYCHEGAHDATMTGTDATVGVCSFDVPDGPDAWLQVATELMRRAREDDALGC